MESGPNEATPPARRWAFWRGKPTAGTLPVPVELTYEMRFEQYRQVATSAIAAAGGVLILLQAGLLAAEREAILAFVTFAAASGTAIFGQDKLIEGIEQGHGRTRSARIYLIVSFLLIGAALGMIADVVVY